jgi:hypothetical protein
MDPGIKLTYTGSQLTKKLHRRVLGNFRGGGGDLLGELAMYCRWMKVDVLSMDG